MHASFGLIGGSHRKGPDDFATRTNQPMILPLHGTLTVGFTAMSTHFRVTYATLSADNEELQAAYETGLRLATSWLGATLSGYVSGKPRTGGPLFTLTSPGNAGLTPAPLPAAD